MIFDAKFELIMTKYLESKAFCSTKDSPTTSYFGPFYLPEDCLVRDTILRIIVLSMKPSSPKKTASCFVKEIDPSDLPSGVTVTPPHAFSEVIHILRSDIGVE